MSNVFKISEAASLGIHSMVILAANSGRPVMMRDIVSKLSASEAHLYKVMQKLARKRLVTSAPGPGGGFRLNGNVRRITLLDIYEVIDGRLRLNNCLFDKPICGNSLCVFDKLLKKMNAEFYKYLSTTRLDALINKKGRRQWKIS